MKLFHSKKIPLMLVMIMLFNFLTFGLFGSQRVEAGFWDEHQGSIITVIKGLIMLWIINLMRENATNNGNDDLLTSTIKKGLNLDDTTEQADGNLNQNEEVIPDVTPQVNTLEKAEEVIKVTSGEQEMVDLVNQIRIEQGLAPLEIDLNLVRIARIKARDMVENNYLEHHSPTYGSPFEMIKNEGIGYSLAGENLASAMSINEAFNALMESPEHRDNILKSRYDRIGVGVIDNGLSGLKIVQLFIDSPDPTE
jgi:uncharacterized YkwD family protein